MKRNSLLLAAALVMTLLGYPMVIYGADYELILLEPSGFDIHRTEVADIDELGNVVGEVDAFVAGSDRINIGFFYSSALDQYWFTEPGVRLRRRQPATHTWATTMTTTLCI